MNTNTKTILVVIVLLLVGFFIYRSSKAPVAIAPVVVPPAQNESAVGCYVATLAKDVYTLNVKSQVGDVITGTLAFKNFEKDSSSGTIMGTYRDGVLLADYSFQSEGMDSVMQVIFKKTGDTFVRGYGEVATEGDRVVFAPGAMITYDPNSTFMPSSECVS